MNWNESQQKAIELSGNLIVSAAAGAGKTAVLTERICTAVLSGIPIERFLVLTFTRAAAAEMKQRIQKRLEKAVAECGDPAVRPFLLAQTAAVNSANISTIDAFCVRLLHRHGHTIGLDADVRVADEIQLSVLTDRLRESFLTSLASAEDPDYLCLLRGFRSEETVWDTILHLNRFLETMPDPDEWLSSVEEEYLSEEYLDRILNTLVRSARLDLAGYVQMLSDERNALPVGLSSVLSTLDGELLRLRALLQMRGYSDFMDAVSAIQFDRLTFPRGTDDSVKKPVQKAREAVKKQLKAVKSMFCCSREQEQENMYLSMSLLSACIATVRKYRGALAEMKQKLGVMDFSDVEHFALRILSDDRIASEYREKFAFIAVDEYQDSNGLQEALIDRIRKKDNLFLVGDVKQSIYRFRSAEPGLFLDKLRRYTGQRGRRVDLNDNYRSSAPVISAVNAVFENIMTEQVAEMDYDDKARLHLRSDNPYGSAEMAVVLKKPSDAHVALNEEGETVSTLSKEEQAFLDDVEGPELEARYIAGKIRTMMEQVTYRDKDNNERPLRYGDFAILLRATGAAQTISEVLAEEGIPCYAQANGGYFDAIEVQILLNCLRVIDNRRQDIPLLSVLRSPLFGFTAEELARIRIMKRSAPSFHEAFFSLTARKDVGRKEDAALLEKARAAAAAIERLHEKSLVSGPTELLLSIVDETGYYELTSALPAGAQRLRNIDALIEKAHAFESSGLTGVWRFVKAMESASQNAALGVPQDSAGDVVRILSIHKSKGLEFPVVFVVQLNHQFNYTDTSIPAVLHADLGIGLRYEREHVRRRTAVWLAVREQIHSEAVAEEIRVLYVAMTRARQNLVLIASAPDADAVLEKAGMPLLPSEVKRARSAMFWLLTAFSPGNAELPLSVIPCEDLIPLSNRTQDAAEEEPDPAFSRALRNSLAYRYPYPDAVALPGKQAVSQAARITGEPVAALIPDRLSFDPPAFLSGGAPTASMRGTATHRLLELLPPVPMDEASLEARAVSLVSAHRIQENEFAMVDLASVAWYVSSGLWKRACVSSEQHREWSFTVSVPASSVFRTGLEEHVLLQGVIDFCFLENGGWILIDYKTDRLRPGETPESHAETHRRQLELYALALTRITGKPVLEKYVVLLNDRAIAAIL